MFDKVPGLGSQARLRSKYVAIEPLCDPSKFLVRNF